MRRATSLIIMSLLVASSFALGLASPSTISRVSNASSCAPNQTISIVESPIPQSFNLLAPSGDSTWAIGSLFDLSLAPFPLQSNGSLAWDQSATNWITSNSNYTQWTFHIRPGLTWSNGTSVNASDIKDWLSSAYALNPQYDFAGLHSEVTGINIVNSDTATIILNNSDAQLPNRIGTYYYAPMVSPTDVAKGPADNLFNPVGDGPWIPLNYTSGATTMTMVPNQFWPGVKPTACAIEVFFVEDSAQMIPFLVSNEVDYAGPLAFGNLAALQPYPNIHLHSFVGYGSYVQYNITEYPYNMTAFRQALAYSINSSAIVQNSLFGYGVSSNDAQGEIPSTYSSYSPSQPQYPYNVSKALSLLHSIGFTGGGSNTPLRFPNGTEMTVSIYTDSSVAFDPGIGLQVQGFFQQLGINTQVLTLTQQNLAADYASNAFNIVNNLVLYSSSGAIFFSPWLDGQQGCNVFGTPGCQGWQASPSSDGQTHWEYPPSADVEYQNNLTRLDATPPTNSTGLAHYLNNIQAINSQYLPIVMVAYPDNIVAYNTAHWVNWPSFYFRVIAMNVTMFGALTPASPVTTQTSTSSQNTGPTITSTSSTSQTSSQTSTTQTSSLTSTTSSKTSSSVAMNWSIVAIVLVIVLIAASFLLVRRKPLSRAT